MCQNELLAKASELLSSIGILIDEDLTECAFDLNSKQTISYIFYIRISEIFHAINVLISTGTDQIIPAQILLRSLTEYYILLRSSIEDETFNSRHIKQAALEKEKWLDKTIQHYPDSGFKKDKSYFVDLKQKTKELHENHEKKLQSTYQLFEDRKELTTYLNIYAPASMYLHGNRQSFNIYAGSNNSVKPTNKRNYKPLIRQTSLASGKIMLDSYEVFSKLICHNQSVTTRISTLLEEFAYYGTESDSK